MTKRDDWTRYSRPLRRKRRRDEDLEDEDRSMFTRLEQGVRLRREAYRHETDRDQPTDQMWDAA